MVHRIKHFSTGISAALLEVIYKLSTFELLHLQCEMDLKVQIKEEPVWVEVTADTSLENYELISEMIPLKQEIKSELTEPGRTQENTFEPSADIKEEILIEEHQVDPNIKENNDGANVAVLAEDTGEKMLRCHECNKTFALRSSLQFHLLIHSGERPYQCDACNSTFARRSNLRDHMKSHAGQRPYHCTHCSCAFTRKSHLKRHLLSHFREKPHQCKDCNATFNLQSALERHMLSHSKDRIYCCRECKRRFSKPRYLREHLRIHSGEKPFKCKECEKQFTQKSTLRTHMLVHSAFRL
ncbi:gastrula zinc finger protein XlCGF52.1-like isoform X1 [Anabrus simplex]|uniref:gastrula zinc finger protein XlCGF52.1-like isoform X1 n=2 Tax=Anabrus simplex TaxID=316456 RepID=UPI0035A35B5E